MSQTTNLGLFKHDNPATNTNAFDVKSALNDNWDKIDEEVGDIDNNIVTIENNLNVEITNRQLVTENLQNQINGLASGSPLVASSVSEMTDTSHVYVNTTDGHWYWYNGTSWIDGGIYQASEDSDSVSNIIDILDIQVRYRKLSYDEEKIGFYFKGTYTPNTGYRSYIYKVESNTNYYITTNVTDATGVGIAQFFDENMNYLSINNQGVGEFVKEEITTPANCKYMVVVNKYNSAHSYDDDWGVAYTSEEYSAQLEDISGEDVRVSLQDDVISIIRPYSDTHELKITMQKCGASSLMQLYGFYYNAIDGVSTNYGKISNTDWVGPYKVAADSNPTTNHGESWYYTGGWHGANNTANGYAVGETTEYKVTCDGKEVPSDGTEISGNHVVVYVKNHLCGNNTTDTTGSDNYRYILQEEITYDFTIDRCDVQNIITALEDIHIKEYYGLQIASNSGKWQYRQSIYGTDIIDIELNNTDVSENFLFNPQYLVATDENNNFVIAHTEHIGLGEQTYNKYTTGQGAHISNGKMYWDLIYAFPYLALASGERAYLKGWYKWLPYETIN